jgi:serine/threonine protein kinase
MRSELAYQKLVDEGSETSTVSLSIDPSHLCISDEKLGGGSGGLVYKGTYTNGSQTIDVAVKKFPERNFSAQELEIHQSLNHPNILKLIGYRHIGYTRDFSQNYQLVFALATKGTLATYLSKCKGPLRTEKTCLQYGRELSQGVYYLHSQRVVHIDLKAENTLILENGTLVINDFGLSQRIPNDYDGIPINSNHGNKRYKAAEGFTSQRTFTCTFAYDVYALGWLLHHLATDNETAPYFNDSLDHSVSRSKIRLNNHKNNVLPDNPTTASAPLAALILSCMKKNPTERPTALHIVNLLGQEDIAFRLPTPPTRERNRKCVIL